MASFTTPLVHVNQDGWGPTELPDEYVTLPFAPFRKDERLGRVADFSFRMHQRDRHKREQLRNEDPEEEEFTMHVDSNKDTGRGRGGRGKSRGNWRKFGVGRKPLHQVRRQEAEERNAQLFKGKKAKYLDYQKRGKQFKRRGGGFQRGYRKDAPSLEYSVTVQPSWNKINQLDVSALSKLRLDPPKAEDLKTCGQLYKYDEKYDRISTRNMVKLERFVNVEFNYATTMDDPVIREYAVEYRKKASGRVVFATDELLSHLMTMPRSVFPWDLVFTRLESGILFVDKREDSGLEMQTVLETLSMRQKQENEKKQLAPHDKQANLTVEATAINQNFSQQVLDRKKKKKEFANPNPFDEEDELEEGKEHAPVCYRYKKWQVAQDLTLIARTEVHSYVRKANPKTGKKSNSYMTCYALNEVNPKLSGGVPWRPKIDSSRGSILTDSLKSNAKKIAKWTVQSLLSGADLMKVGFVVRDQMKDQSNHSIVGTQFYTPEQFAAQINLVQSNMWGIFKSIVDMIYEQPPGKFVLLREPNTPVISIYAVPMDTFDDEDESDDDESDDADDEEEEEEEEEE